MKNWIRKDLQYIWHPYTQMKDCRKLPPIFIKKAKGIRLYDDKGNFYYDTISSWWCNVHGHNHPKINEAIKKQVDSLEHVLFAGFTHRSAVLLAEKLLSIVPRNLARVFFSDDGSTAVETALKMSFQYWHNVGKVSKTKFVSLDHGYHGDTIGAMAVSGVDLFNKMFKKLFFGSFKVPSPYCYRCPMGKERISCDIECIRPLEALLENKKREIAALILEPLVMAAGGMIIYPEEYLVRAAQISKKCGIHMIVDEVATGFGRTGKMFACDYVEISPDFLCLSKGITAGYLPLGATITTDNVYKAFYADYGRKKTFYHGHTYTANPISCSCALASLDIFDQEKTLKRLEKVMPIFHERLERFRHLPMVGDVRYIGMIGAVELVKDKNTKGRFDFNERIGLEIYKKGLKRSMILRPLGDIVYLFLPLCVNRDDIEYITSRTYDLIKYI
ncbi:MAG: adenosylmethionine--8-amino-7-oxononanoate transaminase [Omnitrophica bacterium RIFCSPLOWO2_02_FULL_45_16]|nr:MAG: adenosylmethionine--8-amino-7-oxononanoate transaminase [Omnitrophica bacterium RIFCSPLOWO2_02_FULL_45_16]